MKCEAKREKSFQPVTMSLTFEDESELTAFYSIFAYSPVFDFANANGLSCNRVCEQLNLAVGALKYSESLRELAKTVEAHVRS